MQKYDSLHKWFALLLVTILLIPMLHLYNSQIAPEKVKKLSGDYELLAENCYLSMDITELISSGRSYMLFAEEQYLDKFNEYSVLVTQKELELYNQAVSNEQKEDLQQLIDITQQFIALVQGEKPYPNQSIEEAADFYHTQLDPLAGELQEMANATLVYRHSGLIKDTRNIVGMENRVSFFSAALTFLALVLLLLGGRKIIYPMLVKYSYMDGFAGLSKEAAVMIDGKGNIVRINQAAEKLLHIPAKELTNKSLNQATVLYPPLQNLTHPLFKVVLNHQEIINYQVVYTGLGQKNFLNADYYPVYCRNKLMGAVMIARPVETPKNKRYLFDAIEAERKKISIEIHDWIGRSMSPIIHALDYIMRVNNEKIPGDVYKELAELRAHCQSAAIDMRSIMNDIHPYLIDKVGLISALESYAGTFEQMHNIRVYLFYQNRLLKIKKEAEIIVYRIIQEALSNVVKHSNATEVDIYFKEDTGTLKIEIMDNGTMKGDFTAGNGLWGMKERAHLIGGDLVCDSDEAGFSVSLTIPIAMEDIRDEQN